MTVGFPDNNFDQIEPVDLTFCQIVWILNDCTSRDHLRLPRCDQQASIACDLGNLVGFIGSSLAPHVRFVPTLECDLVLELLIKAERRRVDLVYLVVVKLPVKHP